MIEGVRKGEGERKEYYIHYTNTDRRLDCWVDESSLKRHVNTEESLRKRKQAKTGGQHAEGAVRPPLSPPTHACVDDRHGQSGLGRQTSGHDTAKVRNISLVQFGSYEVDCW